ncbi:hypothetical protein RXV94_07290 [Yeosuana sp. MJ-SS3]|uniref:Uncharacterized protein n=1 Tax=Gilvirhabdus luticola TaxID=3079858 RepID=A0ABU3U743_9FLAO|nr:hypothetical protein [Yeosuana sp. MJ-SS3]MDU8885960.1 hypothetical protein [Yeosuana sp. MJ-SS3]
MKKIILALALLLSSFTTNAQYSYEPTEEFPFGRPNPEAPEQIKDFDPLIGVCNCKSTARNQDGTWGETIDMLWKFKYIANGMIVQDETLKSDGTHSGSIRQFSADSSKWYVHYYTTKGIPKTLPAWEGNKVEDKIILYRNQNAPNGMEGFYRLTFYDISKAGYKWIGEWVSKDETIVYPTWKIECSKME